jgi:thermitase
MQANTQTNNSNILPPRFEGFFLQMVNPGLEARCQEIVTKILGQDWQIKLVGESLTEFEITLRDDALSVKDAWDKSYELRSQANVIDVEPLFAVPFTEARKLEPQKIFDTQIAKESEDVYWGLKQMGVLKVWEKYFPDPNQLPGHGIVIAHPDTGYTQHPEIVDNLLLERGYDFLKTDNDPTDTLEESGGEVINNPGHGTSTASLMISPQQAQGTYANGKYVTGVAPGAKVVPLRISYSVVLLNIRNLAEAIEYAADNGCHVISISMGTALPNPRLKSAIAYAQKRGLIIVAASGTMVPYVVYPAAYDEVIAVCGSNIRREIWQGASRGKMVDVTAPAQALWHAKTRKNDNGGFQYNIEQDSGTSFSAPLVAGVAALWLSYHGRDKLIQRYGAENIPIIFNQMLRDCCDRFPTWKPNKFGAGIVNVEKLMAAPLPDNVTQKPVQKDECEAFLRLFDNELEEIVRDRGLLNQNLAQLLQVGKTQLPQRLQEVGRELAFYLAVNPELYKQFATSLHHQPSFITQLFGKVFKLFSRKTALLSINRNPIRQMLLSQGVSETLSQKLVK